MYKKGESQGICFVKGDDYGSLIEERVGGRLSDGDIMNECGEKVGEHRGVAYYTIGQRKGLKVAMGKPVYVREIDQKKNQIIVGEKLYQDGLIMKRVNWLMDYNRYEDKYLNVKVRHFHSGEEGKVSYIGGESFKIDFKRGVFSITRGQAAVGYFEGHIVFSGIIE